MRASQRALLGAAIALGAAAGGSLPAVAASSDGAEVHHYGGCTSDTSCWQEHVAYNEVSTPSGTVVHAGGGTLMTEYVLDNGVQVRTRSAGGTVVAATDNGQFVVTEHHSDTTQYRSGTDTWGCHTDSYWHNANGMEQQVRGSKTVCH